MPVEHGNVALAKQLIDVADRFCLTELKLIVESNLVKECVMTGKCCRAAAICKCEDLPIAQRVRRGILRGTVIDVLNSEPSNESNVSHYKWGSLF